MPGRTALDARAPLTPDACRRWLHERGDVSLGLMPQLLLDERGADTWGYFWYAARTIDDDVEARRVSVPEVLDRIEHPGAGAADEALTLFFGLLPPTMPVAAVQSELALAVKALGREREWTAPPTLEQYALVVREKAGVPLTILNRLLLAGEDDASIRRFSVLLACSIQIGDDVRDRLRDAALGLQTIAQEEIDLAKAARPKDPDAVGAMVPAWRESAAQWLAMLALERAERFQRPEARAAARLETLLWLHAIDAGQLRTPGPLQWPAPLGALLRDGAPSTARMAAARRVLHNEPAVTGDVRKWDVRNRLQELQRVKTGLPPVYEAFERAARPV